MKKQRKRIGTLGTQLVQRLRKLYFLGIYGLRKNRYEQKTCETIADHEIVWDGCGYVCRICGKKFNPAETITKPHK